MPVTKVSESRIEQELIDKLKSLKYEHRTDIRDRAALEENFRQKFQELNHVKLTDGEFKRLLDEIVTADVFTAAHTLRNRNDFTRDDGTPLNYTLVNITDWCKNTFEVVSQLRINTDYSHHRYDVLLLANGVPIAQIELKTLDINPRRAIEQIVEEQERSWQRLHAYAALLHPAFHRHKSRQNALLREQQRTSFLIRGRRAISPDLRVRGAEQHEDQRTRPLRRGVPREVHTVADDQPLHGAGRERAKAPHDATLPDLRRQGDCRMHPSKLWQRVHLAYHRQRQDAYLLQGVHAPQSKSVD